MTKNKITAVLGPTNTGKTHLAIETMLSFDNGMIGFPLRLLAREVYDKIVKKIGLDKVALITGEEKIIPSNAKYFLCTVESMPIDKHLDFVGVDEIQMCSDHERGHIFTDRLLNMRGNKLTMLMGSNTIKNIISKLDDDIEFINRNRLSKLTYSGHKKISRIDRKTAIIAFSAEEVYAIAELIRRQKGGAAIVMGSLSPKTRNAQVALYQSGDVDFLVATDAIGMGINMDLDNVYFSSLKKFDGRKLRKLNLSEIGQIAGRAGRAQKKGKVIFQTYKPNHPVISYLQKRDYERFLIDNSKLRKDANLFPFCRICLLKLSGENYELTESIAIKLAKYLLNFCEKQNWKLIGPAPSLIAKVGKKFRWQILIHGPEGTKIPLPDRSILWKLIPKNVFLTIDVNPAEL